MEDAKRPFIERRAGQSEILTRVERIEKTLSENQRMHLEMSQQLQEIKNLFAGGRYALMLIGWLGAVVLGGLTAWQIISEKILITLRH
ncbi:MAG TPA: hypothetical protein DCO82_10170 [Alphaproteobacteria bacterium]|nr:hypothetical protein [Alphaproteobacteria bacterium]